MPVCNIVDNRSNTFMVDVSVVFENSWQDNVIDGSTKFEESDYLCLYVRNTTIDIAIRYAAQKWKQPVTLYLYDVNSDVYYDFDTIREINGSLVPVNNVEKESNHSDLPTYEWIDLINADGFKPIYGLIEPIGRERGG